MRTATPEVSPPAIDGARRADLASIRRLLVMENLPSADITAETLAHFLVCRDPVGVVGVVGLEVFGQDALLRSLVVSKERQGLGLGRRLVSAAEEMAAELKVRDIYLLTTTAAELFEYLGYHRVDRELAPSAISLTTEFSSLCPSTAVFMVKP
jgi:amino-acid N-acetyltransferase